MKHTPLAIILSLALSSTPAFGGCFGFFDSVIYNSFVTTTEPSAKLVLVEEMKRIMADCDQETIEKWEPPVTLTPETFERELASLPDKVIEELKDPARTPFAARDGSLKLRVERLHRYFQLNSSQRKRLEAALKMAEERTRKRLTEVTRLCRKKSGWREKMPPAFDQEDSSMCYAATLATEISARVLKPEEASKDPVSAGAISLLYQLQAAKADDGTVLSSGPSGMLGGQFQEAFDASADFGVCRESQVSSELKRMKLVVTDEDYKRLFPKLSLEQIRSTSNEEPWPRVGKLLKMACANPINIQHLEFDPKKMASWRERPEMVEEIQKRLREGEIVGFGTSSFFAHAMIVIDQEYNPKTQECDFIVRNSYGNDCGQSRPKSDFAGVFTRCDGRGNFIVPASLLAENVSQIQSLRIKKPGKTVRQSEAQGAR